MRHVPVAILGGGFAGLAAARACSAAGIAYLVLESKHDVGGVASSFQVGSYTFDYGIHGLYTTDPKIRATFAELPDIADTEVPVSIADYWLGCWTRHPIYANIGQLPRAKRTRFISDFERAREIGGLSRSTDFGEWVRNAFGESLASEVLFPYLKKFWTTEPATLTNEWAGPRFKVPSPAEFLEGTLNVNAPNRHYVQSVRYPVAGGFAHYARAFARDLTVELSREVVHIDSRHRRITFRNGPSLAYDAVISTLPLPVLIAALDTTPPDVTCAAEQLCATSLALVSLGCESEAVVPYHWIYVYDEEISFARVSQPHLWSSRNAPPGTSSIQAEVYFRGRPPDSRQLCKNVCDGLRRMGVSGQLAKVVVSDVRFVQFANVIYDLRRGPALDTIQPFLRGIGIFSCGRYGSWTYALVDEAIRDAALATRDAIQYLRGYG